MESAPVQPPRRRVLRGVVVGFATLLGLVLLGLLGAIWVLHNLETPAVKQRVQKLAREKGGVELDYAAASVSILSGAHLEGVVVASPPGVRAHAPELARIERIDARWTLGSLLGDGPQVSSASLSGVTLTVVQLPDGKTSFDALADALPAEPKKPAPPTKTSHLGTELLEHPLPVGEVTLEAVQLAYVRVARDGTSERTTLTGLALGLVSAEVGGSGKGANAKVRLGSLTQPLALEVLQTTHGAQDKHAALALGLELDATKNDVHALAHVDVRAQDFDPRLSVKSALALEATASFEPRAGTTSLAVRQLDVGAGAARLGLDATLADPPSNAVALHRLLLDADLGRLLGMVPRSIPVGVEGRGTLHAEVTDLAVEALPRWKPGSTMLVKLALPEVAQGSGKERLVARDVQAELRATADAGNHLDGKLTVALARLAQGNLDLGDLKAALALKSILLVPTALLNSTGEGDLNVELGHAAVRTGPGQKAVLEGATLKMQAPLHGHPPFAAHATLALARAALLSSTGKARASTPLELELTVRDLMPDAEQPARTRAHAKLAAKLSGVTASLETTKLADAADYSLQVDAPSLELVRPFLQPAMAKDVGLRHLAFSLKSEGKVEHLDSALPRLTQKSELSATHLKYQDFRADAAVLLLTTEGTAKKGEVHAELALTKPSASGTEVPSPKLTLVTKLDLDAPSLSLDLEATQGLEASIKAAASLTGAAHVLHYDLDAHVGKLGALGTLASGIPELAVFDLDDLALGASAHGTLTGLVRKVGPNAKLTFTDDPLDEVGGEGVQELQLKGFSYQSDEAGVNLPVLSWRTEMHTHAHRRTVEGKLTIAELGLDLGEHEVHAGNVHAELNAALDVVNKEQRWDVSQHLTLGALSQDFAPGYALDGVNLLVEAHRAGEDTLHLSRMDLQVPRAGTLLSLSGNVDIAGSPRRMSLRGELRQDVALAWNQAQLFSGSGQVTAPFRIDSPDLRVFRTSGTLKLDSLNFKLPSQGVEVTTLNGEIPLAADFVDRGSGFQLLRATEANPYWMLRFSDQNPLLEHPSFLSVQKVVTPFVTMSSIAGNLKLDQDVLSLSQLSLEVRNGRITGQCTALLRGNDSRLNANVRASHVESSRGEPFDGNAALAVNLRDHTVDGRIQVLKIGKRHLLDLLDLQDPRHLDSGINRIRSAMFFGYPDKVRVVSEHGFASVKVTFGGLAQLIQIGELRGIPVGPLVDHVLAQLGQGGNEP